MKTTLIGGLLAASALLAPIASTAETLVFGTGNSQFAPVVRDVMIPWAEAVNAAGGDDVQINLRHGKMLINQSNFIDRLTDDVVQITWGLPVYLAAQFPRSTISSMPFVTENNSATAMAYCRLYENGDFGSEWDGFVPLIYVPFPQVGVHLNGSPATSMEDLEGLKIMTGSPMAAGIIKAYGGTPLSIQLPEQYQALQRGTADGTFMSYTAFPAFNLNEVTTDHLHAPLGGATGVVFMTRERFDGLSPAAQAVLEANSGCDNAARTGAKVDEWQQAGFEQTAAEDGHTFTEFSEADLAELRERVAGSIATNYAARVPGGAELIQAWEAATAQATIDAAALLK